MSIYGTVCSIDDPITYYGSHIHPYEDHPRDGSVDVAFIPEHIEDHDDLVRLSVVDGSGGNACVLLTREQANQVGRALMGHDPDAATTAMDLQHAERENRRLREEVARLKKA